MRPEADPMGITREGGSAPGLWEALWVQPSRGFDTRLCAHERALGDRALERSAGGSGMVVAVRVFVYGSPRDLQRGSPWGRRWRMEERGELGRRAGEGSMHSTVAGGGEGDVTDAGAAAAPVPSEGRGPRQMLP